MMVSYSSNISGEVKTKSAVALSQASNIFQATPKRNKAFTSLSCGWASIGSQKKMSISILPSAIMEPIYWSPPKGPLNIFFTGRSSFSSNNLPVVPVAISSCLAEAVLLYTAHSIRSAFLLS